MKAAQEPKFIQAEQADQERTRLRPRKGKEAKSDMQEPPVEQPVPAHQEGQLDLPDQPPPDAPLTAEEGIEMEDTSVLYNWEGDGRAPAADPIDEDLQPADALESHEQPEDNNPVEPDTSMDDGTPEGAMVDMVSPMDALQTLGVDVVKANRFAAAILRSRPSLLELYGRGRVKDMANGSHRNLNMLGDEALDMRTCKPNGEPWNFALKADRMEALEIVRTKKPTWVIGSPPCTAFCRLMGLNVRHWIDDKIKRVLAEGCVHLHFVLLVYKMQLDGHRHFLHEHPHGASSWRDPLMLKLLAHPRVNTTVGHQCQYGLTTPDEHGAMQAAKKPTMFASSSTFMLDRLSAKCKNEHVHQPLLGGRAAAAAFYPLSS